MRKTACLLGAAVLLMFGASAYAQNDPDAIIGTWLRNEPGHEAQIQIYKSNGKYFGKVVWLKEPVYPPGDKMAGKPKVDRENPDPKKRQDPILGMVTLRDFVYAGGNQWKDGRAYRVENGKEYKCKMTLTSPDVLEVRGYIGFSLLGRTETWTRVKG
jgi:uncharacterized protein (DUF2147 family)